MRCPCCGGELKWQRTDRVTTTDMPAQPQPEVKLYDVAVCVCTACGKSVRGEHPEIASNQYGATAHRVGPRLKTMAHALHYRSEEHTSELQSLRHLVCRLLLEKKRHAHGYNTDANERLNMTPFLAW